MKKKIDALQYSAHICAAMKKGILLTTAADGEVNTMTVGWGHVGIEWGRPTFVAYVRESRHTRHLLDKTGEFTVNIPITEIDPNILGYCGTRSGRDCRKLKDLGLTPEPSGTVRAPGIRELPLTLECRVIYRRPQDLSLLPQDILDRFYREDSNGFRDSHIAYYGQILDAYIIEA